MSMEDLFLDGIHDDSTKQLIMGSSLWPVALAAINVVNTHKDPTDNGSLRVGPVDYTLTLFGKAVNKIQLVNDAGFHVATTWMSAGNDVYFGAAQAPGGEATNESIKPLKSARATYVARKLKSSKDGKVRQDLINKWRWAQTYPARSVTRVLSEAISSAGLSSRNKNIYVNAVSTTALAKLFMGEIDKFDIPQEIAQHIESQYRTAQRKAEHADEGTARLKQAFAQDKWLVYSDIGDAVVVGAVRAQPLLTALDAQLRTGELPGHKEFNYADVIVPFKWYPSVNHMDEAYANDIWTQLMMLKVHAGLRHEAPLLPNKTQIMDVHRDYPASIQDLGISVLWDSRGISPLFMLDKTV